MEIKKTTKFDGKIKGCHFEDGKVFDGDGVEIDLIALLQKAYEDRYFDISTTTKTEEIIDLDM